ncbi:protein retinal degeneration B-like isoform X1 [Gordionus sp. m RMFG-2023]|uniref:protein retinal degeneration B-like isoform X1 n=2 Tax=Gordionus sp. m RMFG-2023 TaxID=3053472 RepID=UPI0031FD5D83
MLIKEYRIPMPLSVEEYKIAQLYMIQKKSRKESEGEGSGVEILVNEPYTNEQSDGNIASGQYTYKVYHIGKHLPSWFRSIVPQTAQRVDEEAWNAYPYTKTRYTCPFMEKFFIEIETRYFDDPGIQDNVFNLSPQELKERTIEMIDIVNDSLSSTESNPAEDPTRYVSVKTKRGPLNKDWLKVCTKDWQKSHSSPVTKYKKSIMCAYKLCRIDFRYWGMQSKVEKFINDIALRKTMITAHQQAWCWQDEWIGLDMEAIRKLEGETQKILAMKMNQNITSSPLSNLNNSPNKNDINQNMKCLNSSCNVVDFKRTSRDSISSNFNSNLFKHRQKSINQISSNKGLASTTSLLELLGKDTKEFDDEDDYLSPEIESKEDKSFDENEENDDESLAIYFDAMDNSNHSIGDNKSISTKDDINDGKSTFSPSYLFLVVHGGNFLDNLNDENGMDMRNNDINTFKTTLLKAISDNYNDEVLNKVGFESVILPDIYSQTLNCLIESRPNGFLRALLNANTNSSTNNISQTNNDFKSSEVYDDIEYGIPLSALPLLTCSPILLGYTFYLNNIINPCLKLICQAYERHLLANPYFNGQVVIVSDMVGSILIFDTLISVSSDIRQTSTGLCPPHIDHFFTFGSPLGLVLLQRRIYRANQTKSFDPMHIKNAYNDMDHLYRTNINDIENKNDKINTRNNIDIDNNKNQNCEMISALETNLFDRNGWMIIPQSLRSVGQLYNIFYESDPYAFRLEPFMCPVFGCIPPHCADDFSFSSTPSLFNILNDHVNECQLYKCVQTNYKLFDNYFATIERSQESHPNFLYKSSSNILDKCDEITSYLTGHWWGRHRVDYVLRKCPPTLNAGQFPMSVLPHIFHAGYWQSRHASLFIAERVLYALSGKFARQAVRKERAKEQFSAPGIGYDTSPGYKSDKRPVMGWISGSKDSKAGPIKFKETWNRTKTSLVQNRNISSNHRANDIILNDSMPQSLIARFSYGPLDVLTLGGKKVDIYHKPDEILNRIYYNQKDSTKDYNNQIEQADWKYIGSSYTEQNGKLVYNIVSDKRLRDGIHKIKMVLSSSSSSATNFKGSQLRSHLQDIEETEERATLTLAVLHFTTALAVFSIDGAFAANISLTGSDARSRMGSAELARFWVQTCGLLPLYLSARPDLQLNGVVDWLAREKFPRGLVRFTTLDTSPVISLLKDKAAYLKHLVHEVGLTIFVAYGSSKDIPTYCSLNIPPERIYSITKVPKRYQGEATYLSEGYSAHLQQLKVEQKIIPNVQSKLYIDDNIITQWDLNRNSFKLPKTTKKCMSEKYSGKNNIYEDDKTRNNSTLPNIKSTISDDKLPNEYLSSNNLSNHRERKYSLSRLFKKF